MKARIYINRHKVNKIKKTGKDEPCIAVKTYKGVDYAKQVHLSGLWILKQDFENAHCSGATIWLEGDRNNCVIVGE